MSQIIIQIGTTEPRARIIWFTGTSKKRWISWKRFKIFFHSFQKVKPIFYIDSLHIEWNISSLYFLKFWWLYLTDNENSKFSVSENWNITSIKKGYFKQKCQASEKYVHFYALNTWLGLLLHELLHRCRVAWRWSACGTAQEKWSPGCFDSGLQVICIVRSGVSHLLFDNTV